MSAIQDLIAAARAESERQDIDGWERHVWGRKADAAEKELAEFIAQALADESHVADLKKELAAQRFELGEWRRLAKERLAELEAQPRIDLEALRKALALVERWTWNPDGEPAQFEDVADWFYQETGMLRPGKSQPLEGGYSDEARSTAWERWRREKSREVLHSVRSLLAQLNKEAGNEGR